ncbi:hypothetical protein [Bifidobacterium sp. ESL0745]|uniref:hypothetical protein n=1 Tax=Bifidobacterium sp. ESL0745 TaxID=2983226 RepID=UPI0023FA26C8|nr:hypothetical protein [Bifidobacterium sp. ESL0745]MDF7665344.1 hypothetical protein [Bifidobacterium sp. ESL0745]
MTDSSHLATVQRPVTRTEATQPESDNSSENGKDCNQTTRHWNVTYDYGFEPIHAIKADDVIWITADLLIAQNTWRARHSLPPILLEAPSADWLASLPKTLTGRTVITTTVSEIRKWDKLPNGLGERPWSQLSLGRVPEFRAAQRSLTELQRDLRDAPDDSSITVNTHVADITEEWCVIIRNGQAVASSGYCVHLSPDEDSHDILTVFDNAKFHDSYRAIAESTATAAAQASQLCDASILVGFRNTNVADEGITDQPLNANPNDSQPKKLVVEKSAVKKSTAERSAAESSSTNTQSLISTLQGTEDARQFPISSPQEQQPVQQSPMMSHSSTLSLQPQEPVPSSSAELPEALILEADPVWCTTPYPYETLEETNAFLDAIADARLRQDADGTLRNQLGNVIAPVDVYSSDPWMVRHAAHRYDRF